LAAVGLLGLGACESEPAAESPPAPVPAQAQAQPRASVVEAPARAPEAAATSAQVEAGKALIAKYECNRCHTIDAVPPTDLEHDCAGCHQKILAGDFEATPEELAAWQGRLHSLVEVPTLSHTDRFSRQWLSTFLPEAHDVRPNLLASMPRFDMAPEDAEAIAAFLVPTAEPEPPAFGDADRGRTLLENKGCASCHRMTGVPSLAARPTPEPLPADVFARGQAMAPDLRYVRDRMRPASLVQWIVDPKAVKPDASMPALGVTEAEAADIAAYLVQAELEPVPLGELPVLPPALDREVTYAEVDERIFHKVCRHCHSDPNVVIGDGGPGYHGGFGFTKRGLDVSTYEGLRSGSIGDDGKRRSVFKPVEGKPRIVAHLLARHAEVAGRPVEGVRGMPLGLPPIPMKDIVLLNTWIEQGRKRGPAQ
jgi:cytochrome c2